MTSEVEHIVFDDATDWNLASGFNMTDTDSSHTLKGTSGNDVLDGRGGDDQIYGYGGDDILIGGSGSNYLTGGGGADTFKFVSASASDTVADFSTSDGDKLDVSQLLDGYDPVTSAIADFVKITESGGTSTLSVNVHGTGVSADYVAIATLYGATGLTDVSSDVTNHTLIAHA
jgi:Ca2+-binding RTX toxin-like protein